MINCRFLVKVAESTSLISVLDTRYFDALRKINKKCISCLIIFLLSNNIVFAQDINSPVSSSVITFDIATHKITNGKQIPFDMPFVISLEKSSLIDVSRVIGVDVYNISYLNGSRLPAEVATYLKTHGVPVLSLKDSKLAKAHPDLKFDPAFRAAFDTTGKKLTILMPALKPNSNFDILIYQSLSEITLKKYLTIALLCKHDIVDARKQFVDLLKSLGDSTFYGVGVATTPWVNFDYFYSNLYQPKLRPLLDTLYDDKQYFNLDNVSGDSMKLILDKADSASIKLKGTSIFSLAQSDYSKNISTGFLSLNSQLSAELTSTIALPDRIKNLSTSIAILQTLKDSTDLLYQKSMNPIVGHFSEYLKRSILGLNDNAKKLKKWYQNLSNLIGPETAEPFWLIGTNDSQDLKTKGGSLLSTELGFMNIFTKDNSDKFQYIPKLFLGVDFFFRPVDRNAVLSYLPDHSPDGLRSSKTPLQHWSLSIGLTLGKITQQDFSNFYNSFSLTLGPSYRFARAFRVSGGLALLNRKNANPLLSRERVTAAGYFSCSVDFDFIGNVKSLTDLVFK